MSVRSVAQSGGLPVSAAPADGSGPAGDAARAGLRATHGVRLLGDAADGLGLDRQAPGVFGWASAPALATAPLFSTPIFQAFEVHKLADGRALMLGFVTPAAAAALGRAPDVLQVRLHPVPHDDATVLVAVPYDRIRSHKEHSQRSGTGLDLEIGPAT